jgi:3D (Asp-Asp-Asp) domain-containing protein
MKRLLFILMAMFVADPSMSAREQSLLARVTVYWPFGGESQHASCNGARLQNGHCAVDPKKIPYGSKVVFPDTTCVAVDSGPAVISRLAARKCGKTAEQREALVIDRYFETKKQAMAWVTEHPHFMTVRVVAPHHQTDQVLEARSEIPPKTKIGSPPADHRTIEASLLHGYSPDSDVISADMRGSLMPMIFGAPSPRS